MKEGVCDMYKLHKLTNDFQDKKKDMEQERAKIPLNFKHNVT